MRSLINLILYIYCLYPVQAYCFLLGCGGAIDPCNCPVLTYAGCYTGEYVGDTDKMCINSGTGALNGALLSNAVIENTNIGGDTNYKIHLNPTGTPDSVDAVQYSNTGGQFASNAGTICMNVWLVASTGNNGVFRGYYNGTNRLLIKIFSSNTVGIDHKGADNSAIKTSTNTMPDATWTWICGAWSDANDMVSIKVGTNNWEDSATAVVVFAGEPETFELGDSGSTLVDNQLWIRETRMSNIFKDSNIIP